MAQAQIIEKYKKIQNHNTVSTQTGHDYESIYSYMFE